MAPEWDDSMIGMVVMMIELLESSNGPMGGLTSTKCYNVLIESVAPCPPMVMNRHYVIMNRHAPCLESESG